MPAVAVFWVEAEDHDWDEVASVLGARQRAAAPHDHAAAAARRGALADRRHHARRRHQRASIDELASTLPQTEFTADLIAILRQAYAPGISMSDAFARVLDRTARRSRRSSCSNAPTAPPSRSRATIFAHEVTHPGRTWSLAGEAGQQLAAGGYHTQVDGSSQTGAALFRIDGSRSAVEAAERPGW